MYMENRSGVTRFVKKKLSVFLENYNYKYDSKELMFKRPCGENFRCIQIREDGKYPAFKMYYVCYFICPSVNNIIAPLVIPLSPDNHKMMQTISKFDIFVLDKYPQLGEWLITEQAIDTHINLAIEIFKNDYLPWLDRINGIEELENLLNIEFINYDFTNASEILASAVSAYLTNRSYLFEVIKKRYKNCIKRDQAYSTEDNRVTTYQKLFYKMLLKINCADYYPELLKLGGTDIRES